MYKKLLNFINLIAFNFLGIGFYSNLFKLSTFKYKVLFIKQNKNVQYNAQLL